MALRCVKTHYFLLRTGSTQDTPPEVTEKLLKVETFEISSEMVNQNSK